MLEIGCGTGHSLVELARRVARAGGSGHAAGEIAAAPHETPTAAPPVTGIDISERMIDKTRRRVVDAGCDEHVTAARADARNLPYPDATFNAVFMAFTIELFAPIDLDRVLAECRRVLMEGGRLGVVSMSRDNSPGLMSRLYLWAHEHFPRTIDCRPIHLAALLQAAGFAVQDERRRSLWGLPVTITVSRSD